MPQLNPEAGIPAIQLVGPETTKEVKWNLSFTDEEVFHGVALHEKEKEGSLQTLCATHVSKAHCAPDPALEGRAPKFLGWEKVLHLSQPVVAAGEIPHQPGPQG